jgi:hypothetical protein
MPSVWFRHLCLNVSQGYTGYEPGIAYFWRNVISLGVVEGQNNKAKVVIRKSYGFKTSDMLKISLYHKLGKLPVPELAHEYF